MMDELAYLYGQPNVTGDLRTTKEDFKVFEILPFSPCGEGEHLLIKIRKTGLNTLMVVRHLANYFSVKENLVSYAGLKDRFAVTEQWFGVHLPGKQVYDLANFIVDGVKVLEYSRHNKKLKIGALTGNRFEITLRNVSNSGELARRWQAITSFGVPNYFGEQRFGIDGGNIDRAKALFSGQKVKDKKKKSMYLSAARSFLFNQQINSRLLNDSFEKLAVGDVMMLAGTQSVFPLEQIDDDITRRFNEKDIDITASMWGAGKLMTTGEPLAQELTLIQEYADFCQGLIKFGLKQERRRIRLVISEANIDVDKGNAMVNLSFNLASGCFATTVLRELLMYSDLTERVITDGNK